MNGTTLLLGIVGSRAYGMATETSDTDRLGIYAAPTRAFHGLRTPNGRNATTHTTDPDLTSHEAGKFAALALAGNPTVTELLWLPDALYETRTPLGDDAIAVRRAFLSRQRTADAYLGYATQQFRKLETAGRFPDVPRSRIAKHARHLLRLVEQGTRLWVTGELVLAVPDAARVFDFGERVAAGNLEPAQWILRRARETFDHCPTELPIEPDTKTVENWLYSVRDAFYERPTP